MDDGSKEVVIDTDALARVVSSLTLNLYRMTNQMLVVHLSPPAGDVSNSRFNIDVGAYNTLSLTLPRVKTKVR